MQIINWLGLIGNASSQSHAFESLISMRYKERIFSYKSSLIFLIMILTITSCAPQTDEERIAAINKRIAPEGYLTRTHLHVNWPAEYVGDRLVAKPLKLKIPLEYFSAQANYGEERPKNFEIFENLSGWPLFIQNYKIINIAIVLDGNKPHIPVLVSKVKVGESKEVSDKRNAIIRNSIISQMYNMTYIHRHYYYRNDKSVASQLYATATFKSIDSGYERYIRTNCIDTDNTFTPEVHQSQLDALTTKAKDDPSPASCYEDRSIQFFVTPPEVPLEESSYIVCSDSLCSADFSVGGRRAQHTLMGYFGPGEKGTYYRYKHDLLESKNLKNPTVKDIPQPLLSEILPNISNWQGVVEAKRVLLNSFIVE